VFVLLTSQRKSVVGSPESAQPLTGPKSRYVLEYIIFDFKVRYHLYPFNDHTGSKMVFFELRQQTDTIQALLVQSSSEVSKQMYKFAASISSESIVLVRGVVKKSPIEINATSVKDAEIHIAHVHSNSTCLLNI
jgi:aspartyl/asparaginyl-tRNA synthetase